MCIDMYVCEDVLYQNVFIHDNQMGTAVRR